MLNSGAVPAPAQPESAERVEWTDTRNLPMSRGDRPAAESLKALGLEKHQALIVAPSDGHPHVYVRSSTGSTRRAGKRRG